MMVEDAPPRDLYATSRWYACLTRARAEKQVDRLLASRGIHSYLPLIERDRQWSDRTKRIAFPLFPGYVFARFRLAAMHDLLTTPGIVTVVRANGYPTPLRDEEVESVRILVSGLNQGDEWPQPVEYLEVGQEVIVTQGPFAGMRGVLIEERVQARVAVQLSALRQAVSVELPLACLRAAHA